MTCLLEMENNNTQRKIEKKNTYTRNRHLTTTNTTITFIIIIAFLLAEDIKRESFLY